MVLGKRFITYLLAYLHLTNLDVMSQMTAATCRIWSPQCTPSAPSSRLPGVTSRTNIPTALPPTSVRPTESPGWSFFPATNRGKLFADATLWCERLVRKSHINNSKQTTADATTIYDNQLPYAGLPLTRQKKSLTFPAKSQTTDWTNAHLLIQDLPVLKFWSLFSNWLNEVNSKCWTKDMKKKWRNTSTGKLYDATTLWCYYFFGVVQLR